MCKGNSFQSTGAAATAAAKAWSPPELQSCFQNNGKLLIGQNWEIAKEYKIEAAQSGRIEQNHSGIYMKREEF